MMRPATENEVGGLLETSLEHMRCHQTAREVSAFPEEIARSLTAVDMSELEIAKFSSAFLNRHIAASKSVLGERPYDLEGVIFAVLPIKHCCVYTLRHGDKDYLVISLGFLELLRYEATIVIMQSYHQRAIRLLVEQGVSSGSSGVSKFASLSNGEQIFGFLQACAVRYFFEPGYLPRVEQQLPEALQRKISTIMEPCIMFVILHELGHINFRRHNIHTPFQRDFGGEFVVPESLNDAKKEELYADRYALKSVPENFQHLLLHGALLFFNVFSYFETLIQPKSTHPISLNRINTLYKLSNPLSDKSNISLNAVEEVIHRMKRMHILQQLSGFDSKLARRSMIEKIILSQKETLPYLLFAKAIGAFYEQQKK